MSSYKLALGAGGRALAVCLTLSSTSFLPALGSTQSGTVPAAPTIARGALRGLGELAFISNGTLWDLDGTTGTLRRLPTSPGFAPSRPSFSHDGRWLAYAATWSTSSSYQAQLWVSHGDGTGARLLDLAVAGPGYFAWSPASDLISAVTEVGPLPGAVVVVRPTGGEARHIFSLSAQQSRTGYIEDAAWSPEGSSLAISSVSNGPGGRSAVRSYPMDGRPPTTWFSIKDTQTLPGICTGCGGGDVIADLAGWWPGWGIGFWVFSSGMTHNNDDTPLEVLARPGGRPRLIGRTLSDGETVAIAAGEEGALAIVDSTEGRQIGLGARVETCKLQAGSCRAIAGASSWSGPDPQSCARPCSPHPAPGAPGSGVSVDPAWSPDGEVLAYVKAPEALTGGWPSLAWYETHDLMLWDPRTGTSRRLPGVSGANVPVWSRSGKELVYVSNDDLWIVSVAGGRPVEVAGPLYPRAQWLSAFAPDQYSFGVAYYGQVPWRSQFDWWSP